MWAETVLYLELPKAYFNRPYVTSVEFKAESWRLQRDFKDLSKWQEPNGHITIQH